MMPLSFFLEPPRADVDFDDAFRPADERDADADLDRDDDEPPLDLEPPPLDLDEPPLADLDRDEPDPLPLFFEADDLLEERPPEPDLEPPDLEPELERDDPPDFELEDFEAPPDFAPEDLEAPPDFELEDRDDPLDFEPADFEAPLERELDDFDEPDFEPDDFEVPLFERDDLDEPLFELDEPDFDPAFEAEDFFVVGINIFLPVAGVCFEILSLLDFANNVPFQNSIFCKLANQISF